MPDPKRPMGLNGEHWRQTTIGSVVTAVITAGTMIGYFQVNPPRQDPFTGTEANALRIELASDTRREINRLNSALEKFASRLDYIVERLPPSSLDDRVQNLEDYHLKADPNFKRP